MARPETLIPGNCYFSLAFYDVDLLLPAVDTLIYVGQETDEQQERVWLFTEPESSSDPEAPDAVPEPPVLITFGDGQLGEVLDFDGLMQRLREIAVDHPLKPVTLATQDAATFEDFASLCSQILG